MEAAWASGGVQIGCARGSGETGQGYFGTTSLLAKLLARAQIDGGRPTPFLYEIGRAHV